MSNVIDFQIAAERIIYRRLNCLRTFTNNYYAFAERDGFVPFSFERVKNATEEIAKLKRTLYGLRVQTALH